MHSFITRGNAILAYTLSVLACLTFFCFISTLFIDYRTNSTMNTVKVMVKNVPDYSASREKNDLGFLTFNLQTVYIKKYCSLDDLKEVICYKITSKVGACFDSFSGGLEECKVKNEHHLDVIIFKSLTHLFNWNVKQLFLYLTAEYTTPNNVLNQVVLWDKIILRGENAVLDFKNMNTKYYFWDDGNGLKGNQNVTLTLSWNIIPNAGLLPSIFAIGEHVFTFPSEYTVSRV